MRELDFELEPDFDLDVVPRDEDVVLDPDPILLIVVFPVDPDEDFFFMYLLPPEILS